MGLRVGGWVSPTPGRATLTPTPPPPISRSKGLHGAGVQFTGVSALGCRCGGDNPPPPVWGSINQPLSEGPASVSECLCTLHCSGEGRWSKPGHCLRTCWGMGGGGACGALLGPDQPKPPTRALQNNVPRGENETTPRGPKMGADLRNTNLFLAPPPPLPLRNDLVQNQQSPPPSTRTHRWPSCTSSEGRGRGGGGGGCSQRGAEGLLRGGGVLGPKSLCTTNRPTKISRSYISFSPSMVTFGLWGGSTPPVYSKDALTWGETYTVFKGLGHSGSSRYGTHTPPQEPTPPSPMPPCHRARVARSAKTRHQPNLATDALRPTS